MAAGIPPSGEASFLVEDFIQSVTTQLDRVQDALRIKAVNRPLTYALKELHLELKVFVDMDSTGNVRLRASGPGDSGASVISMDFTTITKPMIEENTISLAATRSTPLEDLGLSGDEKNRLERLGVTNLSQLDRLKGSTGVGTVARLAEISPDRLRTALQAGQPRVDVVRPGKPSTPVARPPRPTPPPKAPAPSPSPTPTPTPTPAPRPAPVFRPPPIRPNPRAPLPGWPNRPGPIFRRKFDDPSTQAFADDEFTMPTALRVPAGSRHVTLEGANLLGDAELPLVTLNGQALEIDEYDHDRLVVRLPDEDAEGALQIHFGDDAPMTLALERDHAASVDATADAADPWSPQEWEPA